MAGEPRRVDEDWNWQARQETPEQRLDRNFGELLQELRVAQTGGRSCSRSCSRWRSRNGSRT